MSDSLWPHGLQPTRLLCPWDFPGKNTRVGCDFLLQGTFLTLVSNTCFLHWQEDSLPLSHLGCLVHVYVYVLSHSSRVQLFVTPWTIARQAPLSTGFSRQEYWSGLPCPSLDYTYIIVVYLWNLQMISDLQWFDLRLFDFMVVWKR